MRFNRFALVAGVLALGVAACGDDVQVVEPTPPQPPPPPPVTATMAPASASVAVGNSVVFAVNASGGVAGEAASWTCASSNTGIATVTSTSAGCSATGVAAGDVTITASVTKSGETVNVGAQLTVTSDEEPAAPPGDPAFVLIQTITGEGNSDVSGLNGRVSVQVGVERGDQTLEMLSVLLDGEVVASQSFGSSMGMAPPEEAAEQAVHTFTLSFDSDDYDRDTGVPAYMNGEHTISAELQIAGGMMADGMMGHETLSSNAIDVEFSNSNFIATTISGLGDGAMNAVTGRVWYGGPDASSIEISALPVLYSGSVSSVTLNQFCGASAQTDSEAPFSFEVECKDTVQGPDKPGFNVGGSTMTAKGDSIYLDFKGPDAPHFKADPNKREDGWVNASVNFTGETGPGSKADGWLVYNDDNAGDGVGGYTPRLRYALAPSNNKVSTAIAADPVTAVVLPPGVSGATKENALCVVVSAVDMLGNESKLPAASANCVDAAAYKAAVEDAETDTPAGLLAGVDVDAPTIKFSPSSPKADATTMRNFQVQIADGGSGIRATDPVTAEAHVRDADESDEIDPLGLNVELPLATTTGLPLATADSVGYYTFTASVKDKAGNSSEEVTRTALHDRTVPVTNTIVGAYDTKTGRYSLIATVTDNLSVKEYWAELNYAASPGGLTITNSLVLPREGAVAVDAYNADDLTTSTLASSFMAHAFQGIQTAGDLTNLTSIGVFARDNAGGVSAGALTTGPGVTVTPGLTVGDNGFDIEATTLPGADGSDADDRKVFQTLVAAAAVKSGTVELKATATGTLFTAPTPAVLGDDPSTADTVETDFVVTAAVDGVQGLRDNPLSRVDFYAAVNAEDGGNGRTALKYIGSVDGDLAGAEDFDADPSTDPDPDSRRYIYELKMSAADFLAIVGGDSDYGADDENDTVEDTDGAIIAIGVGDNENVGFSSAAVELTVKK